MSTYVTCVVLVLAALGSGLVMAQEGSVETLGAPTGPSSGEVQPGETAPPPPCGTQPITMARMQWPSSALLTEVHARILATHFGCDVQVQETDMATAGSSMGANGQPAIAPEMWVSRVAEIWNAAVKAQEVRQGGTSYAEPVFEGWFVPDYVAEQWPDAVSIEGLVAQAGQLGAPGERARFITCPPDWACHIINRNLLRANGLEGLFEVIEPANRFELDTLIAEAVSRKDPIVFYYWQPNAILAQFAFRAVELGAYDRDSFVCLGRTACATPLPTNFAPEPVIIAVSEWVYLEAPQVASYFQRAKMPLAEMNRMLQQLNETGASVDSVTEQFLVERGEVWRPWVGLPATPTESTGEAVEEGSQPDPVATPAPAPEPEPEPEPPVEAAPVRESPNVTYVPPVSLVE